jgi:hypothetical protein
VTDDLTRAENALRDLLTDRADDAPSVPGLYTAVRRRSRRRTTAGAVAAAAAVVLVAVPVVVAARPDRAPAPAATAPTPSARPAAATCVPPYASIKPVAGLRAPGPVAGSLGHDLPIVTAVLRAGWNDLLVRTPVPGGRLDPATAHVRMVQRTEDGLIVGDVGATRPDGKVGWDVAVVGTDVNRLKVDHNASVYEGSGGRALPNGGTAFINQITACGVTYVVVMAPAGSTATATWTADVRADGTLVGGSAPVPMRADGFAVFPPPVQNREIRVAVSKDGREIYSLNVGTRTTQPRRPSHEELATSLERAPGDGDWPIAVELIQQQWHLVPVDQSDPRVLWSGRTASGHTVVVATTALPSGARYVWGAAESATPGPFFPFDGLLGSGKLDDTALVIRMRVAGNATAVVFTGTHRVHAGSRTTTATGGLIVEGGGPVEVDGLQTVDVTDLPHFPGPAL